MLIGSHCLFSVQRLVELEVQPFTAAAFISPEGS